MSLCLAGLLLFCQLTIFIYGQGVTGPLKIAVFNIERLGQQKLSDDEAVKNTIRILKRYDIVFVQKIRDISETALPELINLLNGVNSSDPYKYVVSSRLGRLIVKEQYAYIYRSNRVYLKNIDQYHDISDVFERDPFIAHFHSDASAIKDFVIIGVYTNPSDTVAEIDKLTQVYDTVRINWGVEDVIIAGDLNADRLHITDGEWPLISLKKDPRFQWLLTNDVDLFDYKYDRFIVAGAALQKAIVHDRAKVYNFEKDLGLTHEQALKVSEYYPVELEIIAKETPCSEQDKVRFLPTTWCNEVKTCFFGKLMPGSFHCDAEKMFDVTAQRCLQEKEVNCGVRWKNS